MSDLQLGLIVIGLTVVVGVYGFGFWQQRKLRRKFANLDLPRADVLSPEAPVSTSRGKEAVAEPTLDLDSLGQETPQLISESATSFVSDGMCELVESASDYIALFNLDSAQNCDFLASLWDRRFVFGKSILVCGLNVSTQNWERVVQESRATYATFRVALQLVDRGGPASESRLNNFYDLMQQIAEQLAVEVDISPVTDALRRATKLDQLCAKVDQMIGINIRIKDGKSLFASEVEQIVQLLNFSLQADGKFHLLDENGQTLFTLGDRSEQPFQHHTLNQARVQSLTLFLDVPRVTQPVMCFEGMATLAQQLANELKGSVVDDNGRELLVASIAHIQGQVSVIEADMLAGGITPGSAEALRLFA